jgi:hypothetical protein
MRPEPAKNESAHLVFWRWLPSLLSLLVIGLAVRQYFRALPDLDFAWQIRTGQIIAQTGNLRPPDQFTYTISGKSVPDFEWLYEVLLWFVWSGFGFAGLQAAKILLIATPLVLLGLRLRKEGVGAPGITLAVVTACLAIHTLWNLRPFYCTTIGLLLVSGWLHDHCLGRRPLTWWLPLVMLLWAQLHPGVIAGQGLLLGAIVWEGCNRWLKWNTPLDPAAWRRLAVVGGVALAATFLSPSPIERLLFPFRPELRHPAIRYFVEMRPLHWYAVAGHHSVLLAYLLATAVGASVILRFRQYRLWQIGLLVALGGLANLAIRSLMDWVLIMLAIGAPHLGALWRGWMAHLAAHKDSGATSKLFVVMTELQRYAREVWSWPALHWQWFWPVAGVSTLALTPLVLPRALWTELNYHEDLPIRAVNWIKMQGLHGRFFANPLYGTLLEWELADRVRVYVDTRGFFFPSEVLEDSVVIAYTSAPDWAMRVVRICELGTDYFLLSSNGSEDRLWKLLHPYVQKPLYLDEKVVLLTREQMLTALHRLVQGLQSQDAIPAR